MNIELRQLNPSIVTRTHIFRLSDRKGVRFIKQFEPTPETPEDADTEQEGDSDDDETEEED